MLLNSTLESTLIKHFGVGKTAEEFSAAGSREFTLPRDFNPKINFCSWIEILEGKYNKFLLWQYWFLSMNSSRATIKHPFDSDQSCASFKVRVGNPGKARAGYTLQICKHPTPSHRPPCQSYAPTTHDTHWLTSARSRHFCGSLTSGSGLCFSNICLCGWRFPFQWNSPAVPRAGKLGHPGDCMMQTTGLTAYRVIHAFTFDPFERSCLRNHGTLGTKLSIELIGRYCWFQSR